jgi:hypothetical protein
MRSRNDGGIDKRCGPRSERGIDQNGRRILGASEREGLERQLATIESDRRGDIEGVPRRMQGFVDRDVDVNRGIMDVREKRLRSVLASGAVAPLSQEERTRLESDEKRLRERLSEKMISRKLLSLRPGSLDFTKARNAMAKQEMSSEFTKDAMVWKNMRRQLDPTDPDIANLENIRPE